MIGCSVACHYCPQKALSKAYRNRTWVQAPGSISTPTSPTTSAPVSGKATRKATRQMSMQTLTRCIAKLPADVEVHFTGYSEPALNPQLVEMVEHVLTRGHRVVMATTLHGLSLNDLQRLLDSDLHAFSVHLLSEANGEPRTSDHELLDKLALIKASTRKVPLRFYGTRLDPDIKALVGDSDQLHWLTSHTRAGNVSGANQLTPPRLQGRLACRRLFQQVLLPNGDVSLCCMDYSLRHVLGNLLQQEYAALFKGPAFKAVLAGLKDDNADTLCRSCDKHAYAI